jgi:enoyl-CoA hydratase/carnithine racemase
LEGIAMVDLERTVLYEVSEHVATVTINRPKRYNSLNYLAYKELTEAFEKANFDPDVHAIIFTGTGRGFCTGDDVKELLGAGAAELSHRIQTGELEVPSEPMKRSDKPIIAAVNGAAVGYGMELSLLADIRIASKSARFSEMFVKRAIVAGPDSFELLPQIVGVGAAAEILMTGDLVEAEEALRLGLVSRIVPDDELITEAQALARRITVNAPLAVKAAKTGLSFAKQGKRDELSDYIESALSSLLATDDHKESVAAFLEKRLPRYMGR